MGTRQVLGAGSAAGSLGTDAVRQPQVPVRAGLHRVLRLARAQPLAAFGALLIVIFIVLAFIGPAITPEGVNNVKPQLARQGSSLQHPFGMDNLGRDLYSRTILAVRVAVAVGVFGMLIAQTLAISIGTLSGYFGGTVDLIVQRIVDLAQSVPGLIMLLALLTLTGPGMVQTIVILGVFFSVNTSRVIRSTAISIRSELYVESARALGANDARIILRHVIPNLTPLVLVLASTQMGQMILAEAALSFLGVGIPPPAPSWGRMIADGRLPALHDPHIIVWPGLFLALFVFSWNVLGDGLRDVLDPRLRGSR